MSDKPQSLTEEIKSTQEMKGITPKEATEEIVDTEIYKAHKGRKPGPSHINKIIKHFEKPKGEAKQ